MHPRIGFPWRAARRPDAGGDTVPGVDYAVIATGQDGVLAPPRHPYLTAGPGAAVHRCTVQQLCPRDFGSHFGLPYAPIALRPVRNALDPATAGRPARVLVPPPIG